MKRKLNYIQLQEARKNKHFYRKWGGLKQRCDNKNEPSYKYYGGRGIRYTWLTFKEFADDMYLGYLEHVEAYGERNTTIDRINVDSDYCKSNCRWATYQEQVLNRRGSIGKAQPRSTITPWHRTFICSRCNKAYHYK